MASVGRGFGVESGLVRKPLRKIRGSPVWGDDLIRFIGLRVCKASRAMAMSQTSGCIFPKPQL